MKKHQISVLILVLLFIFGKLCYAADNTVTIITEGNYIMGDGETMNACEQRAFENAKRSAIEQAGTYVESYSQANKLQLSKDEVEVISAGLVEATLVDKKRILDSNGAVNLWCKVKCVIKLDSITEMKGRLSDKQLIGQYKDLQANNARLQKELTDLKLQMQNAISDAVKKATEVKIVQNEQQASVQKM